MGLLAAFDARRHPGGVGLRRQPIHRHVDELRVAMGGVASTAPIFMASAIVAQ